MTLRYLLDTGVVSSPASKAPNPEILRRLEAHAHECAIAAPVWHELTFGWRRLPAGKRKDALEAYLREVVQASFPILPYDEAAASWHGAERARLEASGRPAPYADGQIAAVAYANGLVLVTLNTADFARFKDVELQDWSRRRARG
ncbi:MAG: type II toxin-antitoxin system VapC family toxin [Betaproteobacteria bacterium]|nr:MAG: type II toxin-antitoxin system VapC family toxin [Betaproteobacteria bacterium]